MRRTAERERVVGVCGEGGGDPARKTLVSVLSKNVFALLVLRFAVFLSNTKRYVCCFQMGSCQLLCAYISILDFHCIEQVLVSWYFL